MKQLHIPVLLDECTDLLINKKSGNYFEATMGFGGHTEEILNKLNSKGTVVSTDVDDKAFGISKEKFKNDNRVSLYNFNYELIDVIAKIESIEFKCQVGIITFLLYSLIEQ